jgi:predicted metal-dependent hydrolase
MGMNKEEPQTNAAFEYDPTTGFSYSVRVSARAKYARLNVSAEEGLAIVIPRRFQRAKITELIEERRDWIRQAEERVAADRAFLEMQRATTARPRTIELTSIDTAWRVEYWRSPSDRLTLREQGGVVSLHGPIDDERLVAACLQRWLSRVARDVVAPWLLELADERAITVGPITVRGQRTRWASCSASGSMSLNRNLLFLREDLVKFVLKHELCHRLDMSHSARFWQLLTTVEPRTPELNEELKSAWRLVPYWAQR